ncbi:helix-turn-helix domain-containing protein [Nocardia cyriacigeorgica]|uniref:helix-turn-helix domain-containing protein n=1 Tax=Nocardia cyriacigeorgica TaxID=135487 RepID=UPI00189393EB|nr:helix-turn-helix transcriptional regulator [Nocardia cyriacigeorgica]MBF6161130.1 helix-turn-helix transcriptional regulator [Nocardia cyriacigeorgica]MBF6199929.1 helix-turn-helix transcriptional regulator [Nocardia cyriacigeorgica]
MEEETIGDRIRRFRGKALTQRELAERSNVSLALIRALEQGARTGASIASLQKIARALDVDIADLVGKRYGIPSSDPDAGVVAIRRALTSVDDLIDGGDAERAVSLDEARRAVDYAWGAYWNGRYEVLTSVLPPGIGQLRATAHSAQAAELPTAHELLARMYWVTGCTLVHMGQTDPAFMAIRHALDAAQKGNDPLLAATLRGSVAWQLLVQGRYEESHAVALKAAAAVEPTGDVADPHLSVYGSLVLQGATAAGRDQRTGEALALADAAGEVAGRMSGDRKDYETNFGPSQVVMQTVDINVSTERYPEALDAAKAMPNHAAGLTQVSQARHLLDKAAALARTGQRERALDMLLTAERVGGQEWVRYQTLLRQIVSELLDHDRQAPLRAFADRVGIRG